MSRRPQKKRRPGGGGAGNSDARGAQADSRLVQLLVNAMTLPAGSVRVVNGVTCMTQDAWLYGREVLKRCAELGGDSDQHLDRAYQAVIKGGRQ